VDITSQVEQHPAWGAHQSIGLFLPAEIDSLAKLHVILLLYGYPGTRDNTSGLARKLGLSEHETANALANLRDSGWVMQTHRETDQGTSGEVIWSHVALRRSSLRNLLRCWSDEEARRFVLRSLLRPDSITDESMPAPWHTALAGT